MTKDMPIPDSTTASQDQLELSDAALQRLDQMHNAVHHCLCELAEKDLKWNMEIIGTALDGLIDILSDHNIPVRYPAIVTDKTGKQIYVE